MFDIMIKVVKVYYCDVSCVELKNEIIETLPEIRRNYVESISDYNRKKQSVLVWKLLEFAIKDAFGIINPLFFVDNGKWGVKNDNVFFSLSHSANVVAVAIGMSAVGVDVERISDKLLKLKSTFNSSDVDFLASEWTKKESLFKSKSGKRFFSKKISDKVGNQYCLTACTDEMTEFIEILDNSIFKI